MGNNLNKDKEEEIKININFFNIKEIKEYKINKKETIFENSLKIVDHFEIGITDFIIIIKDKQYESFDNTLIKDLFLKNNEVIEIRSKDEGFDEGRDKIV